MTEHRKPRSRLGIVSLIIALGALGLAGWVWTTVQHSDTTTRLESTEQDKATLEGEADSTADRVLTLCARGDRVARVLNEAGVCEGSARLKRATGPQGPVGPEGAQGPMGPQGPQGPQGERGPRGIQGPAGEDGQDGAGGAQGPAGPQGEPGPQGEQGPQGPQGEDGQDGAGGQDGADGTDGKPGPACPDGYHGEETTHNGRDAFICYRDDSSPTPGA